MTLIDGITHSHLEIETTLARAKAAAEVAAKALPAGRDAALDHVSEELARLRREVKSHAEFEESQLFPALARVLGDRPPEVDRLVQEHRELSAQLDALDQAMNTRDAGAVCAQLVAFAKAFDAHSLDEADILDTTANIMEPGGPAA